MGCPNVKLAMEVVRNDSEHFIMMARCRKWTCPYCSHINSRNLSRLLKEVLSSYLSDRKLTEVKMRYTVKLVTLTVPGREFREAHSAEDAEILVKNALRRLLDLLKTHYGLTEYFWVREFQADGMAHIHLLILGSGISGRGVMRFINDSWECLGMGRAETALVRSVGGTVHYLCKYLGKSSQMTVDVKGSRAFGISKSLRDRVREFGKIGSEDFNVVKIYRVNGDGSLGEVIWEVGEYVDFKRFSEDAALKELMEYFDFVGGGSPGCHEQLKFKGEIWEM